MSDGVRELLSRATAGVTERYTHRGLSRLSEGLGSDAGAGRIVARRLPKVRDEGRDRHLPLENGYWRGATEVRKCPDGGMAERLNAPVLKTGDGPVPFVGSNPTPSAERTRDFLHFPKWRTA